MLAGSTDANDARDYQDGGDGGYDNGDAAHRSSKRGIAALLPTT